METEHRCRKKISQIIVIEGGYSVKANLQMCRASKHFWASKLWVTDKFQPVLDSLRGSSLMPQSRPPLCVIQDDYALLKKQLNPFTLPLKDQAALYGHYTRDCNSIPSTLSHLCFLLEEPRTLRTTNLIHCFASAEDVYGVVGDLESGTPTILGGAPPGALMVGLRLVLASMAPLFGSGSFELFVKEKKKSEGKMNDSFLSYTCTNLHPLNKEVTKFVITFMRNVMACQRENQSSAKSLAEAFPWAFVRFSSITPDSIEVAQVSQIAIK
eukprot:Gregarina_sp_Poly_1__937@NODE_1226_length_4720_cov_71_108532_g834_i0_p2_GENE_NODE_1226_length_4720_cov_71_108532_g834_i0NODE_1226_length_4720_cov_71_108532_g834_i0_p2_ORF_typecomplete_len269_score36_34RhoGAP/PF00620_27/0_00016_NODE_1226_length_4720_cov_71_108532_g834_i031483954